MSERDVRRVVVVGTSGAGKSTFAQRLAAITGAARIELDALYWQPGWQASSPEDFLARVAAALGEAHMQHAGRWVTDGNYRATRALLWPQATAIIWLNYPLPLILWRLWWRTLRRCISGQNLYGGDNRENWRRSFCSRDSIFVWAWTSHFKRRREYAALRASGDYAQASWLIFRRPAQAEKFLQVLSAASSSRA